MINELGVVERYSVRLPFSQILKFLLAYGFFGGEVTATWEIHGEFPL